MRLIDADELKDQLIRALRIDTVNENAPIGDDKRHTMKIEYKFSFYEIVKLLNQSPTITSSCDADSILGVYDKGYSEGREDALSEAKSMKNYCENDCDALHEAYDRGYSKGFSEGREEEKKEVMLLTDHCFGKCNILDSVLHMEGGKHESN